MTGQDSLLQHTTCFKWKQNVVGLTETFGKLHWDIITLTAGEDGIEVLKNSRLLDMGKKSSDKMGRCPQ